MDFTNKVVLVTGAGAGIGRAASLLFAKNGAKVAVNALMPNEKQSGLITVDLIRENGGEAVFIPGDISKSNTAEMIIKDAIKAFGKIDILINNAGIVLPGRVDTISEETFDLTMLVNVKGTFLMSKYAIPEMQKQGGGVIVNTGSVAALKGHIDRSAYCASKGNVVDPSAMEALFVGRKPVGRLVQVEVIAQAIAFAACEEAAYMTGSIIVID